jgi:uncharacterized protein
MSSGEDRSVLSRLHQAFNERDAETARGLLATDIVWHVPGNHPMAGVHRGRDVWDASVAPIWSTPARVEEHALLQHPDHAHEAVLLDLVHDLGDGELRLRTLEVARITNGLIVEWWEFPEDQAKVDRLTTALAAGEAASE